MRDALTRADAESRRAGPRGPRARACAAGCRRSCAPTWWPLPKGLTDRRVEALMSGREVDARHRLQALCARRRRARGTRRGSRARPRPAMSDARRRAGGPAAPPSETGRHATRVVVVGGGFGGLACRAVTSSARCGTSRHPRRPPQLRPLPAARPPGRDGDALVGRDRVAAASRVPPRPQRGASCWRRYPASTSRAAQVLVDQPSPDLGAARPALRPPDRRRGLGVLVLRPRALARAGPRLQVTRDAPPPRLAFEAAQLERARRAEVEWLTGVAPPRGWA